MNQPVLCNKCKVSCSRKQRTALVPDCVARAEASDHQKASNSYMAFQTILILHEEDVKYV